FVCVANTAFAQQQPSDGVAPSVAPPVALRPNAVPYQEGWPVPPGYHVESRIRKGLLWSGAVVFGVFYTLPLGASKNPGGKWVFVPIAGPALYASHRQCPEPCDDIGTPIFVMTFTGGQLVGAALLTATFLAQKQWLVQDTPDMGSVRAPA